jgi:hypothetical protein
LISRDNVYLGLNENQLVPQEYEEKCKKDSCVVMGGKTKRRKYKKQKGGFTYKNNAKRRSFTSSIKTTSTGSNFARGKSKKSSRR